MYKALEHEAKFYYPLTDNEGNSTVKHLSILLRDLSQRYGGTTTYQASGTWYDDTDQIYTDELLIISVFSNNPFNDTDLNNYAMYILNNCKQLGVSIEVSGVLRIYEHDTTDSRMGEVK